MAVTLKTVVKAKPAAPIQVQPFEKQVEALETTEVADLTIEALADRYGALTDRAQAIMLNPVFVQLDETLAELKARLATMDDKSEIAIKGAKWLVEAGVCSKSPRKITDPLKVMEFIGAEAFAAIAKVGVSDAEKYLTPEQFVGVVSDEKLTKNRKITTTPLA